MRRLPKSHDATFFNGSTSSIPPSNLDHVYASSNLQFRKFPHPTNANKDAWIGKFSDHSMLYFEIQE